MSDVKWISIVTDIFNDEKMCAIESLPKGLDIELVWFKLLCLAGTCNANGFLMLSKEMPYTDQMLAKNFRMDLSTVQEALQTFIKMGMIEKFDNIYVVVNWTKYQNVEGLEHIREVGRKRQRRYRERQKAILEDSDEKNPCEISDGTSHEIYKALGIPYIEVYKRVIEYLNNTTGSNYTYKAKKAQKAIHARLEEGFTIENFKSVIDKKYREWVNTDYEKYLRPETLFGNKFDGYLNQKERGTNAVTSAFDNIAI